MQLFLEENKDMLSLVYLPPYSPKLNLIEGLWGWMEKSVINNDFFISAPKISEAVKGFIYEANKIPEIVIDRHCVQL